MFKFFSRFGIKKRSQDEIEFRAHCRLIRTSLRKRVPIQIRLANKKSAPKYTSLLVDFFEDSRKLVFDRLQPIEANSQIKVGNHFTVDGNLRGLNFNFKVEVLAIEKDKSNNPLFRTTFPSEIYTEQQRAAFRVSVSSIRKIKIIIISTQHPPQKPYLRDISATGFQFVRTGGEKDRFNNGDLMNCCIIFLPDSPKIICRATVQHVQQDEENNITRVGCKFVEVGGTHQRIINRFINNVQRENRRREQGEDFDKTKENETPPAPSKSGPDLLGHD
ncbi:MAG: flagellar brake protein [Gammaproteobacteria bacterium]|nr:flagellar brake protein [Gammaproteobacteria bacterium]